jgi:hypothetical protein
VTTKETAPTRVFAHSDRGLTDTLNPPGAAMAQTTERPTPAQRIALIRSIAGHADGRDPALVLREVQMVLDGATLDEVAAMRDGER